MDSITTIKDYRIRVKASEDLLQLLENYSSYLQNVPENLLKILKNRSIKLGSNIEETNENTAKNTDIDVKLLKEILKSATVPTNLSQTKEDKQTANESTETKSSPDDIDLYLSDLRFLHIFLAKLRKDHGLDVYLNDLLKYCQLELPQNEIIKRNPELEARCQRLREQQQNLEYRKMTKNVDAVLKHYPEDTVAYQIKAINSQVIAVLQFVFSVAAGFAFGFLGVNLIIGNMEFGLRLLLGIMCALIIALAEIYFLAKKLNEYDNTVDTANKALKKTLPATKKTHLD